eukprot:619620-Pleurochrysis_carterae.AAC.1
MGALRTRQLLPRRRPAASRLGQGKPRASGRYRAEGQGLRPETPAQALDCVLLVAATLRPRRA